MGAPEVTGATLSELAAVSAQLAASEELTAGIRARRDRLVLTLAEADVPHDMIGDAAVLSVKGVGKITRAAGLRRYAPREAAESTVGESESPGS
jgi:hypothetical protein